MQFSRDMEKEERELSLGCLCQHHLNARKVLSPRDTSGQQKWCLWLSALTDWRSTPTFPAIVFAVSSKINRRKKNKQKSVINRIPTSLLYAEGICPDNVPFF